MVKNSGVNLVCHPTEYYGSEVDDIENQALISQQSLSSNLISLWIKNSLTTNAECNFRAYKTVYAYNLQYNGATVFLVIVNMVRTGTPKGCSDIKTNTETTTMYQFKHYTPNSNPQIVEWMNKISIEVESYLDIVRQQFNLYSTSSCPLFRDYMDTRKSEW